MKGKTIANNKYIIKDQSVRSFSHNSSSMVNKTEISPIYAKLVEEGHKNFYNYLDWLGLAKDPDFLILTSSHHYYFENEDLETINIVVNLKQLNDIKRIEDFLHTIYHVLPQRCYFVGSFTDHKNQNGIFSSYSKPQNKLTVEVAGTEMGVGRLTSLMNMLNNIIDPGTNRYMNEKIVTSLLESACLKILDITDLEGITYFCTQKDKSSAE